MLRRRNALTTVGDNPSQEQISTVRALGRFLAYHSAQPPDEYVDDFLYLIKPGRLLATGQHWVRQCTRPENAVTRDLTEIVQTLEMTQPQRTNLDALAAYALAKTGSLGRVTARPAGERIVALIVGHVRALRLVAAAVQRNIADAATDAASLAALTAAYLSDWPDLPASVNRETLLTLLGDSPRAEPPGKSGFFVLPTLETGNRALDDLFRTLHRNQIPVDEPQSLLVSLLCPDLPAASLFFRRRGLPPFLRLKALGYDERGQHGFTAELSVERWAGHQSGSRLIRHPDSLFVVTDEAFDQALALATRLAAEVRQSTPVAAHLSSSGQIVRWSLRRDSSVGGDFFFASGSSISGAFAAAFQLVQTGAAWLRPFLNVAVVASLAENGALLAVDASTLKAKLEATTTEKVILSVGQTTESAWLLRHHRRMYTSATLDDTMRQGLHLVTTTLLRQYWVVMAATCFTVTLATWGGIHQNRLRQADKRTDFDVSAEFSPTSNPAPYSPWKFGWLPAASVPDANTFILFRFHHASDGRFTGHPGIYDWYPPDADKPSVSFMSGDADAAWPAAGVLWPCHALHVSPDPMGTFSCVRFVVPRDGTYRTTATYWGASTGNYGATVYLLEANHLVCTRVSTSPSTIRRKDAVSFVTKRGESRAIVHEVYLFQGQTIDLVVGMPPEPSDGSRIKEQCTGLTCHIHRIN